MRRRTLAAFDGLTTMLFTVCLMLEWAIELTGPESVLNNNPVYFKLSFKTLEQEVEKKLKKIQNLFSEENKNKYKKVLYEGNNETCLSSSFFRKQDI